LNQRSSFLSNSLLASGVSGRATGSVMARNLIFGSNLFPGGVRARRGALGPPGEKGAGDYRKLEPRSDPSRVLGRGGVVCTEDSGYLLNLMQRDEKSWSVPCLSGTCLATNPGIAIVGENLLRDPGWHNDGGVAKELFPISRICRSKRNSCTQIAFVPTRYSILRFKDGLQIPIRRIGFSTGDCVSTCYPCSFHKRCKD
jgi:hypothetical protein